MRSREEEIVQYAALVQAALDKLYPWYAVPHLRLIAEIVGILWDILDAETVTIPAEQPQPCAVSYAGKSATDGRGSVA